MHVKRIALLARRTSALMKESWPAFVVFGSFLLLVTAVVPPSGDAFMSDDWDFAASVCHWERTGRLTLSDFPSMTLIGHLAWGRLFVMAWGCEPWVLRTATMTMTWLAAFLLYRLARTNQVNGRVASLLAASVLFQPLFLFFSYTFLTDIAACLWMLLIVTAFQMPAVRKSFLLNPAARHSPFAWSAIALMATVVSFAYLVRQTAVVPAIAAALLLFPAFVRHRIRRLSALLALALTLVPILVFWIWIERSHGVPLNYEKKFLQIDLVTQPKILIVKSLMIVMTLGLYLAPISIYALFIDALRTSASSIVDAVRPVYPSRAVIKRFLLACSLGGLVATAFWLLPPLRNVRPLFGIHPHDLDLGNLPLVIGLREHLYSPVLFSIRNQPVTRWGFFTLPIACTSVLICVWLVWRSRAKALESMLRTLHGDWPDTCQIFAISLIGQFFLLLFVRDVFDRYLMPVFILSVPLFFPFVRGEGAAFGADECGFPVHLRRWARCATTVLVIALCAVGVSSAIWTHDRRIEWQIAWKTGEQLLAETNGREWLQLGQPFYGSKLYRPALERQLSLHDEQLRSIPRNLRIRLLQQRPRIGYVLVVQGHEAAQLANATKLKTLQIPTWRKPTRWDLYRLGTSPTD